MDIGIQVDETEHALAFELRIDGRYIKLAIDDVLTLFSCSQVAVNAIVNGHAAGLQLMASELERQQKLFLELQNQVDLLVQAQKA